MVVSVSHIQNVLRTYDKQLQFARLNLEKRHKIKQSQVDRVDISIRARELFLSKIEAEKLNEASD